ncbi:hypothetical protein GQ457_01G020550 [Hibiscus cannabinus]
MKILCWNCQGLGQTSAVQVLKSIVFQNAPDVIFLCETRLNKLLCERLRISLNMVNCFSVDSSLSCSGLAILWNNIVSVDLLSYSAHHIDTIIHFDVFNFHFSELHGYADTNHKYKTWQLIDQQQNSSSLPWLLGGDFNEILADNEKQGGPHRARSQIDNFCNCLSNNNLFYCRPKKGWFTWTRSGPNTRTIFERLDRFIATPDWFQFFRCIVFFLNSKPCPIIVPYLWTLHALPVLIHLGHLRNSVLSNVGQMTKMVLN